MQPDVADPEAVRRMVGEAEAGLGRLDVLVNNAGLFEPTPFDTAEFGKWQAGWQRVLDTNLMSAVHATWAALPGMRARGRQGDQCRVALRIPCGDRGARDIVRAFGKVALAAE